MRTVGITVDNILNNPAAHRPFVSGQWYYLQDCWRSKKDPFSSNEAANGELRLACTDDLFQETELPAKGKEKLKHLHQ